MTVYQYCIAECVDRRQLVAQANVLGAEGWQLLSTDGGHGFMFAIFERVAPEGEEQKEHPQVHNLTGDGVFDVSPPIPQMRIGTSTHDIAEFGLR